MDKATQTMIDNLHKNTGKSLDEWIQLVQAQAFSKHGEVLQFLKSTHGLTHGFANLIAHKAKGSDAGSAEDPTSLIDQQYAGKEHLRPLYDALLAHILTFGEDIEIAPKNAYVSLRRKKQFALLHPATKTRFEVGLNLKGHPAEGPLLAEKPNAMCSHKINLTSITDLDETVLAWIRKAYEGAG